MEFDVVVIGSGPGGYVAAIRAAELGFTVACIDKRKEPGGTCLNVGCIPSKALLHTTELYAKMKKEAVSYGISCQDLRYNWQEMQGKKSKVVLGFQQGILALFAKHKISYLVGEAKFLDPYTVQVAGDPVRSKFFILATGSTPISLPFLPFDEKQILSSTGALALEEVPKRLLVIGAGAIGLEIGSIYKRLGSEVECIEFFDRVCPNLDISLSQGLQKALQNLGMQFHLSSKVTQASLSATEVVLRVGEKEIRGDKVLVAIGRKPYTQNLSLSSIGLEVDEKGRLPVDGRFCTKLPHIFAVGDVIDGPMLAHKASEEGIAVAEILAGKTPSVDYPSIPNIVYTHPEAASVGFTEAQAAQRGLISKSYTSSFSINPRAKCMGESIGFVKVVVEKETKKMLGMHILGVTASELIALGVMAIQKRMTVEDLALLPLAHPTLSESIKEVCLEARKG